MLIYFLRVSTSRRIFVGIKKLHGIIDMARQTESQYRVNKFLLKLEEEGGLDSGSGFQQ